MCPTSISCVLLNHIPFWDSAIHVFDINKLRAFKSENFFLDIKVYRISVVPAVKDKKILGR